MTCFDVFNGDADGICALVQLRLAEPREAELVTGIKRDINLLRKVQAGAGDKVTVLDISMQKNHEDLQRLLAAGSEIVYVDHHNPGERIVHERLTAHIDQSASICTALIVNHLLQGQYHLWALTAAFGDNVTKVAYQLADTAGLSTDEVNQLKSLGTYLNYNGYGETVEDLFYHPADLYRECVKFASPLDFVVENKAVFEQLEQGYKTDMAHAEQIRPLHQSGQVCVMLLPEERWARRVSGVYGNWLSHQQPNCAHAVISVKKDGDFLVSLRAPKNHPEGADEVAGKFSSGGGRKAAAGINQLKENELPVLIDLLEKRYG